MRNTREEDDKYRVVDCRCINCNLYKEVFEISDFEKEKSIFAKLKIYDHEKAFANAMKKGMQNPEDWMYMHSSKFRDYFKHYWTRRYTSYFNFNNIFK